MPNKSSVQWGDPGNKRFPVWDKESARRSMKEFLNSSFYGPEEALVVMKRLKELVSAYGVSTEEAEEQGRVMRLKMEKVGGLERPRTIII